MRERHRASGCLCRYMRVSCWLHEDTRQRPACQEVARPRRVGARESQRGEGAQLYTYLLARRPTRGAAGKRAGGELRKGLAQVASRCVAIPAAASVCSRRPTLATADPWVPGGLCRRVLSCVCCGAGAMCQTLRDSPARLPCMHTTPVLLPSTHAGVIEHHGDRTRLCANC